MQVDRVSAQVRVVGNSVIAQSAPTANTTHVFDSEWSVVDDENSVVDGMRVQMKCNVIR